MDIKDLVWSWHVSEGAQHSSVTHCITHAFDGQSSVSAIRRFFLLAHVLLLRGVEVRIVQDLRALAQLTVRNIMLERSLCCAC
jgi:predicted metal-dependent hydrolase